MTFDEHARLMALDPWLRTLARENQLWRAILVRHVRGGASLETTLADLRLHLVAQGAPDLGWPEGASEQVETLRRMRNAPPPTPSGAAWWAGVVKARDEQYAEQVAQGVRRRR